AAGIVIRAARVGSFQRRFFSRRLETEGEAGIFNTLLGRVRSLGDGIGLWEHSFGLQRSARVTEMTNFGMGRT
ncbi:hypothetical protein MX652_07255, partial [Thauera aromatica]